MPGPERRQLFALTVLAVVFTLAALYLFEREAEDGSGGPRREMPHRSHVARSTGGVRATHLVDPVGHPPEQKPEREDRAGRSPEQAGRQRRSVAAQRAVALSFLRSLLRYELAAARPRVRAAVRASAEPGLARLILSQPPRVPAGAKLPPPGRVVSLVPVGQEARGRAWLTATVDRGGRRSGLLLELRERHGRWLISDLR